MSFSQELDVAIGAARAAGARLRGAWNGPRHVDRKGAVDLVTEVDRACEADIRAVLERDWPGVPILGEEEGGAWDAPTRWVIDPIDGTTNFVHGFPWFAVSIGLEVDGERAVGVIYEPIRDRLYTATRGGGARVNGARMRVSATRDLGAALLATGFPYDRRERVEELVRLVREALVAGQGLRRAGAACLDLAMVAEGRLDAYFELQLRPWDAAAGALLVTEAGGRITDEHGSAELDARWPAVVASNGALHDAVLAMIQRARSATRPRPSG